MFSTPLWPCRAGKSLEAFCRGPNRACADEFGRTFASKELVLSHPGSDHLFNRSDVIGFHVLRSFSRRARVRGSIAAEVSLAILKPGSGCRSKIYIEGFRRTDERLLVA